APSARAPRPSRHIRPSRLRGPREEGGPAGFFREMLDDRGEREDNPRTQKLVPGPRLVPPCREGRGTAGGGRVAVTARRGGAAAGPSSGSLLRGVLMFSFSRLLQLAYALGLIAVAVVITTPSSSEAQRTLPSYRSPGMPGPPPPQKPSQTANVNNAVN